MIISGVLVVCRTEHLAELRTVLEEFPWLEIHHEDGSGRIVVTVEAVDIDESMERVQELQRLPNVILAEMAEYYVGND